MPSAQVKFTNEVGLHARPAAQFTKAATGFAARVELRKDDQTADAKSLLSVLKLDVRHGDTVTLVTEGADADEALTGLVELVGRL